MSILLWIILIATVLTGGLAGVGVEGALVKLPARRRIGVVAYATFARGNDLGNGLVVYPIWAVGSALFTFIATIVAYIQQQPIELLIALTIASLISIAHFLATSRAAPVMLSLRHTPDDEAILRAKLDKFELWSAVRTALQVLTFFVLMWALIVAR
ncbi:MAG: hypothetical protein JOZ18_13685 [Chloroflexi bacterium]|nr:hypothetical protein [Chloroflexota bacterium]